MWSNIYEESTCTGKILKSFFLGGQRSKGVKEKFNLTIDIEEGRSRKQALLSPLCEYIG